MSGYEAVKKQLQGAKDLLASEEAELANLQSQARATADRVAELRQLVRDLTDAEEALGDKPAGSVI